MRFRSLRTQLILGLVVIGALSALINSVVQIKIDYHDAFANIDAEFEIVENYSLPSLQEAVDDGHPELIQAALQGVFNLPAIHRAEVKTTDGMRVGLTGPETLAEPYRSKTFPVASPEGELVLTVHASLIPVEEKLFNRTKLIIVSNAMRTIVAVLFVIILMDRLFMRHLHRVTQHLRTNTPGQKPEPLSLSRNKSKNLDELDELVQAVNQMQDSLSNFEATLRREKNRYIALVENNPEAIWRCQIDPPIQQNWSVSEKLAHLKHHLNVVETNQTANEFNLAVQHDHTNDCKQLAFTSQALWLNLIQQGGHVKDFVTHAKDKENHSRYFSSSVALVNEDGLIQTIWGITVDITARTLAQRALEQREQELQSSQQRLAEAQALAHMGHWDYRTYGNDLTVSDEFARIYGFRPGDKNPSWQELQTRIHPDDLHYVTHSLSSADSEAIGAEHRIIWPSGETRYVQAIARKQIERGVVTATFGIILDITEQRRAEEARRLSQQALIESEARMAEAQALAHMGHWMLDYGKKEFTCSDEFYRLYGHQPASFKADFRIFNNQIHPEDRARIEKSLTEVRERAITEAYRIILPNGDIRYLRGTATPFYSGGRNVKRVLGICIDITEQVKAEAALKATQKLVTTAFTASPDGIAFIHAENLTIITSNPTLQKMIGYTDEELKNQPLHLLQPQVKIDKDIYTGIETSLEEHQEVTDWEINLTHKLGHTLICLVSWRTITQQNQVQKLVFIRDVTQLRQLEIINEQQNRKLIHADKLASLGTMVAGVAHEINNPNHILQMNVELLTAFNHQILQLLDDLPVESKQSVEFNGLSLQEVTETMPELYEDMKSCCRRIDRIIKDLKDFARPRENALYLPLDLNQVIRQSQSLIAPALEDTFIKVHYELNPLPLISGDSQQLQQVIINLLMNAIDALSPADNGKIRITTRVSEQHKRVICTIKDNGCGISPDHLKQIFDPFFTTKQETGGTGLGLAISFQLIREHGGLLEANSKQGKGTTITISLPAAPALEKNDEQ